MPRRRVASLDSGRCRSIHRHDILRQELPMQSSQSAHVNHIVMDAASTETETHVYWQA